MKTIKLQNEQEYQELVEKVNRAKANGHDVDLVDVPVPFGTSLFIAAGEREVAIVDSTYFKQWTLQDFVDEIEFVNGKPSTTIFVDAADDESRANIYTFVVGPLSDFGRLMTEIAEQNEGDAEMLLLSHLYSGDKLLETIDVLKKRTHDELFAYKPVESDDDEDDDEGGYVEPVGELAIISEFIRSESIVDYINDSDTLAMFVDVYSGLISMFDAIDDSYQKFNRRKVRV